MEAVMYVSCFCLSTVILNWFENYWNIMYQIYTAAFHDTIIVPADL